MASVSPLGRRDAGGEGRGRVVEVLERDHPVHQAPVLGGAGVDRLAGQQHLHRARAGRRRAPPRPSESCRRGRSSRPGCAKGPTRPRPPGRRPPRAGSRRPSPCPGRARRPAGQAVDVSISSAQAANTRSWTAGSRVASSRRSCPALNTGPRRAQDDRPHRGVVAGLAQAAPSARSWSRARAGCAARGGSARGSPPARRGRGTGVGHGGDRRRPALLSDIDANRTPIRCAGCRSTSSTEPTSSSATTWGCRPRSPPPRGRRARAA